VEVVPVAFFLSLDHNRAFFRPEVLRQQQQFGGVMGRRRLALLLVGIALLCVGCSSNRGDSEDKSEDKNNLTRSSAKTLGFSSVQTYLAHPLGDTWKKLVDITGIEGADRDGSRRVEFEWQYDLSFFPQDLSAIFEKEPPRKDARMFTRYDDGWRVNPNF
jgi:hypothetical protein